MKISVDAEENPGPKRYSAQYLTISHCNLKSIGAHNFIKVGKGFPLRNVFFMPL